MFRLETAIEKVNLDQLQYQVTMLKSSCKETVKAKLMRLQLAKKYINLLEDDFKKEV